MRFLLAVILIAASGWSGYWFVGQNGLSRGFETWFEARRAEGWVAETSDITVQGFPNRFDTGFSDLVLADPATGLAWEAEFFQILAKPRHRRLAGSAVDRHTTREIPHRESRHARQPAHRP